MPLSRNCYTHRSCHDILELEIVVHGSAQLVRSVSDVLVLAEEDDSAMTNRMKGDKRVTVTVDREIAQKSTTADELSAKHLKNWVISVVINKTILPPSAEFLDGRF